jgi:hypothetical protein
MTPAFPTHRPILCLRAADTRLAIALAIPGAYFAGAVFPPKVVLMLYPRYSPPAPEASSKQGQDLMNAVEREMQELYHVAHLRSRGDEYYETREWERQGDTGTQGYGHNGR